MTTLPERLRASAKAMNALDSVSLRPSTLALIDRGIADRIARELEEAAQALEAGRGEPVAWRVRGHAFDCNTDEPRLWHYYTGSRRPTVGVPYRCDIAQAQSNYRKLLRKASQAPRFLEAASVYLEELRFENELTAKEFAAVLGISGPHYSEFVNGKRALPKPAILRAIRLGIPAEALLTITSGVREGGKS